MITKNQFSVLGMRQLCSAGLSPPTVEGEEDYNTKFMSRMYEIVKHGSNWDSLSLHIEDSRRRTTRLSLSHVHIDQVLLRLNKDNNSSKSPYDAKCALKFFQWAGHRQAIQHTIQSYSITIHILVRANMFLHAQPLLEDLIKKYAPSSPSPGKTSLFIFEALLNTYNSMGSTPAVFDFLIHTYAKARMFGEAINTCHLMKDHGFVPSLRAWNTLLQVVKKSDQTKMVWKIYEEMLISRTYPNNITLNILVSALCKEGALQKTIDLLDKIQRKRSTSAGVVNATLVLRALEEGRVEEGNMLLKRMMKRSLIPLAVAYALMLYGKCKIGDLQQAMEIHQEMVMKGLDASDFTYTALIGGYCSKGMINKARDLMTEMIHQGMKPYDVTYNFLIQGYCKIESLEEACSLQDEMLERGFLPSVSACNDLISQLCKRGQAPRANHMFTMLLEKNFTPNESTYSNLIDGYCKEGNIQEVLKLYYEMEYKTLTPSIMTFNLIVRCLCMNMKIEEARRLLSVMPQRGLIPDASIYKMVMEGLRGIGRTEEASQLCHEMTKE